ncbi:ABC-type siderophore export system fused ATPase/permease subunit [Azospirillum agricola]|uniref:hypothetical protein n=1 Tax=Azospirillum agricola TaxID=1720247 RepID=UPI001AE15B7C|nr:hypothetical protein [Azospirillum agricola]MBP2230819.1 ABC-type siderophore export system fused ATPase/permease subunit [Azospirillum agricola]
MTRIDQHSATWAAVTAWAERERASIRDQIDSPATSHDHTQVLRGQLAAIADLLALAEERPAIAITQETYGL